MPGLLVASGAHAQLSGRVSVDSQYRQRGYAVVDAKPVVTATLSYDHSSGVYANGLVIVGPGNSDIAVRGIQASLGYAANVTRGVSIDAGVARTNYARVADGPLDFGYTEFYAGVTTRSITARVYYSPDYYRPNRHTLYAEIEGNIHPLRNWNLNLHLGALTYLSDPPRYTGRSRYDWRATVSRNLNRFEVYAGVSGRGPGGDYYVRSNGRAVLTGGVAVAF